MVMGAGDGNGTGVGRGGRFHLLLLLLLVVVVWVWCGRRWQRVYFITYIWFLASLHFAEILGGIVRGQN